MPHSHNHPPNCASESHSHDHDHDHSHSHSHSGHSHDHSDDLTPALQNHIYQQIDFSGIRTLNEATAGSGRQILQKTWAQRLETEPELESDADEQIIIHIPFTAQIRLHSLHILTSPHASSPRTLHLYANTPDLDFSTASTTSPTQILHLTPLSSLQDLPIKRPLFANCSHLTLFFVDNHGEGDEDVTRVSYVGFKGDWTKLSREPVEVLYEAAARPSDHKVEGQVAGMGMGSGLGSGRRGF